MSREVKEIGLDFNKQKQGEPEPTDDSKQGCYMRLVGSIANISHLKNLIPTSNSNETNPDAVEAAASISSMEDANTELILEDVVLKSAFKEANINIRASSSKYEGYFNATFYDRIKGDLSYEKLNEICRHFEQERGADGNKAMAEHNQRVNKTNSYFVDRGLSQNDARAAALAISFYTGTTSGRSNQDASKQKDIEYRTGRVTVVKREEAVKTLIICNHLLQALLRLPYYRGCVSRSCTLEDNELGLYSSGSVIIWPQFNGTFKGESIPQTFNFAHRNTFFRIYSLTGRSIKAFSNYEHEDEILFLPDSTFLVLKHLISHHGKQHTVYMRQVELGLSTSSVLWVDDQIFSDTWNNQEHMIYAEGKDPTKNIRFIQKSSTDSALSFLQSPFGQLLKNASTFRIVTDMYRDNEESPHNAGARFIKRLRKLGFNNQCLLFVGNSQKAQETINRELDVNECQSVKITISPEELRDFISFQSMV